VLQQVDKWQRLALCQSAVEIKIANHTLANEDISKASTRLLL
jgi:hypothetical protein